MPTAHIIGAFPACRTECAKGGLALLSQGYTVDTPQPLEMQGIKDFQPDDDEHATLEFRLVCALTPRGSILYASAIETRYELKKIKQSAGISIPTLGSLSLPFGSSTESLVKVGSETVTNADFYERFFDLVAQQLGLPPSRPRD